MRPISTFLSRGRSTPAIRAIFCKRSLSLDAVYALGLRLQMMRVTPCRLTTLQCSQIGLTLLRTFTFYHTPTLSRRRSLPRWTLLTMPTGRTSYSSSRVMHPGHLRGQRDPAHTQSKCCRRVGMESWPKNGQALYFSEVGRWGARGGGSSLSRSALSSKRVCLAPATEIQHVPVEHSRADNGLLIVDSKGAAFD